MTSGRFTGVVTAIGMFGFAAILPAGSTPLVSAQDECIPTHADPATVNLIGPFYLEERGVPAPWNISPPFPGSGETLGGDGTWTYRERNGLFGLQRGGTGIVGGNDPITDENCEQGPDRFIGRADPAHLPLLVVALFSRATPDSAITGSGTPACSFTIGIDTASAVCGEESSASCISPTMYAIAQSGTVGGQTACTGSAPAEGTFNAPGGGSETVDGFFGYPLTCTAEFPPGATGLFACMAL